MIRVADNMDSDPPPLEPCPFCGLRLHGVWRKRNPKAKCETEGCWGAKLPVMGLDVPEQVDAWNTRWGRILPEPCFTCGEIKDVIRSQKSPDLLPVWTTRCRCFPEG